MSRRFTVSLLLSAVMAVLATGSTPAVAGAAPATGANPAVAAALHRIATKTHTAADIALIKRDPALARVVMDPARTTVSHRYVAADGTTLAGPVAPAAAAMVAEQCGVGVQSTITAYTIGGFVFFRWTHLATVCIDLISVTRWWERYDRANYLDPTLYFQQLVGDSASPTPSRSAFSYRQRHLEQCVIKWGCFANYYPWSEITLNGDGSWSRTWGIG